MIAPGALVQVAKMGECSEPFQFRKIFMVRRPNHNIRMNPVVQHVVERKLSRLERFHTTSVGYA